MVQEEAERPEGSGAETAPRGRGAMTTAIARAVADPARFGRLPERVRPEGAVEEKSAAVRDPARGAYDSDEWLVRCCG
ncbi:hypothetical protein [Streptomyces sp. NBC_00102]|uniref:hypothetical protein n=1 Tax=Streptomyces sp. NBC_00102 TaxID=2975652 RepID=UPI00225A779C|nr:hypothetical protein [Streptomyces sp. NBC_00102]MCX5396135.1 hypothetical protein [Streptomyces sp. NBC_00102]